MPRNSRKLVRRSISLRPETQSKVQEMARRERRNANQVLEELILSGIAGKEKERSRFFELAERLSHSTNRNEQQRIKEELARMTFGE